MSSHYTSASWIGLREAAAEIIGANNASDATYNKKLQRRANEALEEFALENSDGLLTRTFRQYLPKQVTSVEANFLFVNTESPWVLEIRQADGTELDEGTTTGWLPNITGRWNGLMWLEVETSDGTLFQVQSREWWREGGGIAGPARYYVSLWYPYPDFGADNLDTNIAGRIWCRYLSFPSQVAKSAGPPRVYRAGYSKVLDIVDYDQQYEERGEAYNGVQVGPPYRLMNASTVNFPAIQFTPVCSKSQTAWAGPVEQGTFKFRVTAVLGEMSQYHHVGPTSLLEWPLYETGPSPESAAFAHSSGTNAGYAIDITLPNIDFMEHFYDSSDKRHLRSGWRLRIYVCRTSVYAGAVSGTVPRVEADGAYYLLHELEVSSLSPSYTWTGAVEPSRGQRLRYHSGTYDLWLPWPIANDNYVIEWPIAEMPVFFEREQDEVPVRPEFVPAFRELFMAHVARADGRDLAAEAGHRAAFTRLIGKMRNQRRGTPHTQIRRDTGGASLRDLERLANYDVTYTAE